MYGRYNKKLKPHENINLPAALLSRFDIIYLLLDIADTDKDMRLAKHVTQVHQTLNAPKGQGSNEVVDQDVMRSFISYAQTFNPVIPADLHNYLVARYTEKRNFQREGKEEVSYMYITARYLLGIIRISQSLAKFHFRNQVHQSDVDQAIKLMDFSYKTLNDLSDDKRKKKHRGDESTQDLMSLVINDVRNLFTVTSTL